MAESLIDIVQRLADPRGDRYEVGPAIFVTQPPTATSDAVVLVEDPINGIAPSAPEYRYLLEVSIARQVLDVWPAWRGGAVPTPDEAVNAVIHYATNDSYLPAE